MNILNYPDNFNTPTFPAGPSLAVSRWLAIGISVVTGLIVVTAGLIFWGARSGRVDPFLISIDQTTGLWSIVGHDHMREMSATRTAQEAVVAKFVENWFTVSASDDENNARWQSCDVDACAAGGDVCPISCAAGADVFNRFIYDVVPDYTARVAAGETWGLDAARLVITPDGAVTENGGAWRISGKITSNMGAPIEILAFATVSRDVGARAATLGFYVSDFNAYRINE